VHIFKVLKRLLRRLRRALRSLLVFYLGSAGSKKQPQSCCVCPPALKQPDPLIYCQYYLLSLGFPVTWDNPDIYVFEGSALVNPDQLKANTAYTVVARIWNNSTEVPVVNLNVAFSFLSFGMGTKSNPIGSSTTDLSVKGLPGCPAFASIAWTTPAALGHYCIQVLLLPPDDSNWLNNLGQRNIHVTQPQSPAQFTFAVGNHEGPRRRVVRFTVDAYSIPPLLRCGDKPAHRHREVSKVAPPVPAGWSVTLSPDQFELAPGEERTVQAEITPPAGFTGSVPINVTGWDGARVFGGVTLTVEVP
jgi:hypothetical protein